MVKMVGCFDYCGDFCLIFFVCFVYGFGWEGVGMCLSVVVFNFVYNVCSVRWV